MTTEQTIPNKTFTTKEIVLIAMFTAIIAVCAWITVPIGPVSFNLQIFGIFCAVGILGGRRSLFAVLAYLLLGAVGLPVFDGFSGGISALLSNSGGYLIGFIFIPLMYMAGEKFFGDKKWCVTPFVPFDLAKLALSIIVSGRIKKYAKL